MTGAARASRPGGGGPDSAAMRRMVEPVLEALGITLLDCSWKGGRRGPLLRLTVDRPGGITIDECGAASEAVSQLLDLREPELPEHYSLEVSSPGAERFLLGDADYRMSLGRRLRVRLVLPTGEAVFEGRLVSLSAESLELEFRRRSGRVGRVTVARPDIESAQVVVDI